MTIFCVAYRMPCAWRGTGSTVTKLMMSVWRCMGTEKRSTVPENRCAQTVRGLLTPHPATYSAIGRACCTLDWSSLGLTMRPEVRSIPPLALITPPYSSVELVGVRSRSSTPSHCSTVRPLPSSTCHTVMPPHPGRVERDNWHDFMSYFNCISKVPSGLSDLAVFRHERRDKELDGTTLMNNIVHRCVITCLND